MENENLHLDPYKNAWVTFAIIALVLAFYVLLSFISYSSSDGIGVIVIPLAAISFYGPIGCLIACFYQATQLKKTQPESKQQTISLWRLAFSGMPILFMFTGFCGVFAFLYSPLVRQFFLLAPSWVFYGLAPF